MRVKQNLNEVMGVPNQIKPWVDVMLAIVESTCIELIREDIWESGYFNYKGEDGMSKNYKVKLNGNHFNKLLYNTLGVSGFDGLYETKMYKEFPLFKPELEVYLNIYSDDVYFGAGLDRHVEGTQLYTSGPDDVKINYEPYLSLPHIGFDFTINMPTSKESDVEGFLNTIRPKLKSTISHELLHVYQQYKQLEGRKKTIGFGDETILNKGTQELRHSNLNSWNEFLHMIYLHLSFESNARVTQLYYELKEEGFEDKKDIINKMIKSTPWLNYQSLKDFNPKKTLDKIEDEIYEHNSNLDMFDRLGGFEISMQELLKSWSNKIEKDSNFFNEMGLDINKMPKVPESAINDPIKFFNFFDKRFKKSSEKMRRKLTRVVNMLVQEKEEEEKQEKSQ